MKSSIEIVVAVVALLVGCMGGTARAQDASASGDNTIPVQDQITAGDRCYPTVGWNYCGPDGIVAYKVAAAVPVAAPHPFEEPVQAPPEQTTDPARPYNNNGAVGTAVRAQVGGAILDVGSSNPITLEPAPTGYHWVCQKDWSGKCQNVWLEKDPTLLGTVLGLGVQYLQYRAVCGNRYAYFNPYCRGY